MKRLGLITVTAVLLGVMATVAWGYRWHTLVVARKLSGALPEVDWADLVQLLRASPVLELHRLATSGSAYSSVHDPYSAPSDGARGRQLFSLSCEKCHGSGARGGLGPALVGRSLTRGDSDWALYRTIMRGVPGTAMVGGFVARADAWRIISYLHQLGPSDGSIRGDPLATGATAIGLAPDMTYAELVRSKDVIGKWQLPLGSYNGQRFSPDSQINVGNVAQLAVRWVHQFPSPSAQNESAPIVTGNYLYVTEPPGLVYALDARTGAAVWQYSRSIPADIRVCCVATTRGIAVLGQRVYFGTLDAHLVALDATSGRELWDQMVAQYTDGYSITSAPLPVRDSIITGIAGGEFPTRGFISAYDAITGVLRWRFNTVPGPGEPGNETWSRDSWKTGGAATWGLGAYDPDLGLVYWGIGTAAPDFNAAARPGNNLYSSSIVALDAATGKLAWYFQFLPGDDHDWDSTQTPTLIDVDENGTTRKLLTVANRGGFFYVLDRITGRFVRGAAFIKQTWALGLSPTGQPVRAPNSSPSPQGTFIVPSVNGAVNWWPASYSPLTGLHYVNVEVGGGLFFVNETPRSKPGRAFVAGATTFGDSFVDVVKAIDPVTAAVRWEHRNSTVTSAPRGGLLSTAGGVVFGSDGSVLYALDAAEGRMLWSFDTGGHISAPPITYRIGNDQVIAVMADQDLFAFGLIHPAHSPRVSTAQ